MNVAIICERPMTFMGVSIRAYARHRGVSDTAVYKAIRTGRIQIELDGTIDVHQADQAWKVNIETPKYGSRQGACTVESIHKFA